MPLTDKAQACESSESHRDLLCKQVRPQSWQRFHSALRISTSFYLQAQDSLKYSVNIHGRVLMVHGLGYVNYFTLLKISL